MPPTIRPGDDVDPTTVAHLIETQDSKTFCDSLLLLGICFLRKATERAGGSNRPACRSRGEDWRARK